MEFYEFHDFRYSGIEQLFVFFDFHNSGVEPYEFHDIHNSSVELLIFMNFLFLVWTSTNFMIFVILEWNH